MLSATDIITRCERLAAGGWHPESVCLSWWSDAGWEMVIEMADWVGFGTPQDELPQVADLPVFYAVNAAALGLADNLPQGVSVLGGSKAPAYQEPLVAAEGWWEQAEAIIKELWQSADGDSSGWDAGQSDLRATAYKAMHRWHRCRVWRWMSEESRALRERADALRVDRALELLPTPESPVKLRGRGMTVLRPCGCVTQHWRAPGKGGVKSESRLRFGAWLAQQPCLQCQAEGRLQA